MRLEILYGSAAVALGLSSAAQQSFERALQAEPELTLDPEHVSPKIIRSFNAARLVVAGGFPDDASLLADGAGPP